MINEADWGGLWFHGNDNYICIGSTDRRDNVLAVFQGTNDMPFH